MKKITTCTDLHCPERTGGKCNAEERLKEADKELDKILEGICPKCGDSGGHFQFCIICFAKINQSIKKLINLAYQNHFGTKNKSELVSMLNKIRELI